MRLSGLTRTHAMTILRLFLIALLGTSPALARDLGQWDHGDEASRTWFENLMQPDTLGTPSPVPCCGEGDAYWADSVHVEGGKVIAEITDDRDDRLLKRLHVPVGTRFEIPAKKMVDARQQRGNPTGHTIIFLGTVRWINNHMDPAARSVLCFVPATGS